MLFFVYAWLFGELQSGGLKICSDIHYMQKASIQNLVQF
jgi:hypothetical protein